LILPLRTITSLSAEEGLGIPERIREGSSNKEQSAVADGVVAVMQQSTMNRYNTAKI
jgi:hypothetical protein